LPERAIPGQPVAMTPNRRLFLSLIAGLACADAAWAQGLPVRVAIDTAAGTILVELFPDKAPVTCANFLRYVDEKRFNGAVFYRTMRMTMGPDGPAYGLIQGGTNGDPARRRPPIAHEPTTQTGLRHVDGTISMARFAPGSATGEFFICVGEASYLDANPALDGDNLGYAAFGQVVEGMGAVRAIHAMPTSPTAGEGVMKGQMLEPKVVMTAVRRV